MFSFSSIVRTVGAKIDFSVGFLPDQATRRISSDALQASAFSDKSASPSNKRECRGKKFDDLHSVSVQSVAVPQSRKNETAIVTVSDLRRNHSLNHLDSLSLSSFDNLKLASARLNAQRNLEARVSNVGNENSQVRVKGK